MSQNLRPLAGDLIAAVLPRDGAGNIVWREAARTVVDGEYPEVKEDGHKRRDLIHQWRTYFKRWVEDPETKRPVATVSRKNAEILERHFPLNADDLKRPVLSEDEERQREIERQERKLQRLRGEL